MDGSELNELISRALSRGLQEGVNENKISFPELIGMLEMHKLAIFNLHNQLAAQRAKANAPRIIPPGPVRLPQL